MSVFISWAGADREVKNVIAEKLREEKIEYFDSDEHCVSNFSEECIANIRRSRVFIVIVSEASMDQRSYVRNEIIEARRMENDGHLNILVYKITDAPYNEFFTFNLNHISDSNHVARIQRGGGTGAIDTLIKRAKHLLALRDAGTPEKPHDVLYPRIVGTPVSIGAYLGYFVERSRDGVLEELREAFERSNAVILSELFGFGKKSVIRKFVESRKYSSAIEIEGMHDSLYDFFLHDLRFSNVNDAAFSAEDPSGAIRRKFELLSRLDEKHIVIISDVDIESEPNELVVKLLRDLKCHVAIVTQNAAEEYRDFMPVISVGRMESEYLSELFFHYFDKTGSVDREALLPSLEKFFDGIGGHTKTVEIAASVLAKEMFTVEDEIKNFLTSSDGGSSLVDRIVTRLGGLIDLESFTEDEKNALLLISLIASPVIELNELTALADACNISVKNAVNGLCEHRWITYNRKTQTVYIEPIIARLCATKLLTDYTIPDLCLKTIANQSTAKMTKDAVTQASVFSRLEHLFSLTGLSRIANLVKQLKATEKRSSDTCDEAIRGFLEWYYEFRESFDPTNIRDVYMMHAAAWAALFAAPAIETYNKLPALLKLSSTKSIDITSVTTAMIEELTYLQSDPLIETHADFLDITIASGGVQDVYGDFILSLQEKNYDMMNSAIEALLTSLEDPEIAEDPDSANLVVTISRIFANACSNTGAFRTGISFIEKLLPIEFSPCVELQLLLIYLKLILDSADRAAALTEIVEASDSMLEEAAADGSLAGEELNSVKREHLALSLIALARANATDEAIERFDALIRLSAVGVQALAIDGASEIIDILIYEKRRDEAVAFIEKYLSFFNDCISDGTLDEDYREEAEKCISIAVISRGIQNEGFTKGGIIEDVSYYQRYSREKKNGMFKMMAFNRVADGVRRFDFSGIDNADFPSHTARLRERALAGENKMKLAPEAFALVSEAGYRTLGYRHHYVQYVGAAAMLEGKIAEILNGEGKTYTIPLVAFVNSLYSEKVFVLDDSEYLTERNYKWMRGLYSLLGIGAEHITPKNKWDTPYDKGEAAVFYSSIASLAFSTLTRDLYYPEKREDLCRYSVIIDEADAILVESASAPWSITENTAAPDQGDLCERVYKIAERIFGDETYYFVKNGYPRLTGEIRPVIEEAFGADYDNINTSEMLTKIEHLLKRALYYATFERDKDYFIRGGAVYEEYALRGTIGECDGEKGFFLARREGLDASRYVKKLSTQSLITNKTYISHLIERYGSVSGASATASSFKKEFKDLYGLEVISIPPALPIQRKDRTVTLFVNSLYKDEAICRTVIEKHGVGQPILIITKNVRESQRYSEMLTEYGIPHKLLNATNSESSPEMLAGAGVLGSVLVATQLANRGVDIKLGGDPERMTLFELCELGYDMSEIDRILYTAPSAELCETELYRKYHAVLEKNRAITLLNKEKVIAAGGLCVIGTEPYDNLRVEQQMRGRAGRQGAVGESYVFESIDDDLFRPLIADMIKDMLRNSGDEYGLVQSGMLSRTIDKAQDKMHHARFNRIKHSAEISKRIEISKEAFFDLMDSELSGEDIYELLRIWSSNPKTVGLAIEELTKNERVLKNMPAVLSKLFPEILNDERDETVEVMLYEAAQAYLEKYSVTANDPRILPFIRGAMKSHLSAMDELEEIYRWKNESYTARFFMEQYEENRLECLVNAIEGWLFTSVKKVLPTNK